MLDKSKGLVLGPELVTNGDFSNGTTGWTLGTNWSVVDGKAVHAPGALSEIYQSNAGNLIVAEKFYKLTFTITASSRNVSVYLSNTYVGDYATGTFSVIKLCTSAIAGRSIGFSCATDAVVEIDNISVRELPGSHAFQSTSTNRPVLSGRYNLLTKTEQFDDAGWRKSSSTVTGNTVIAPDGALTADKLVEGAVSDYHYVEQTFTASSGAIYVFSVYAKAGENNFVNVQLGGIYAFHGVSVNLTTGAKLEYNGPTSTSVTEVGNGWWRISISQAASSSGTAKMLILTSKTLSINATYAGDGTSGNYIWGADIRVANDGVNLPPYQRVNTATDYDTTGFPLYLSFNGLNQWMQTAAIDFTATDKMTVFAGVLHISNAGYGGLVGLGTTVATAGSFLLWTRGAGGIGGFEWYSSGNTTGIVTESVTPTLPRTSVVSATGDLSLTGAANELKLRLNGAALSTTATGDCGTGNYSNAVITIGNYNSANFFNGRLYSMVVRGAQSTAQQITDAETYINSKTKAYA